MARPVSTLPAVIAEDLEDDCSLPVLQFSSLTAALLGTDHSDKIGISACEPWDPLEAKDRVAYRPRRTYERKGQSSSSGLEISQYSSENPSGPANQHSCLQPVLREGKEDSVEHVRTCLNEFVECKECALPRGESSSGSVPDRTTCRSMPPTCRDGSQAQSVPKFRAFTVTRPLAASICVRDQQPLEILAADHKTLFDRVSPPLTSIIRMGGNTLNRPARRIKLAACEPLTVGSEPNMSERMAKEADAKDYDRWREPAATISDRAGEQTPYV